MSLGEAAVIITFVICIFLGPSIMTIAKGYVNSMDPICTQEISG